MDHLKNCDSGMFLQISGLFLCLFSIFFKQTLHFLQQIHLIWKNIHPVHGVGIQTHVSRIWVSSHYHQTRGCRMFIRTILRSWINMLASRRLENCLYLVSYITYNTIIEIYYCKLTYLYCTVIVNLILALKFMNLKKRWRRTLVEWDEQKLPIL